MLPWQQTAKRPDIKGILQMFQNDLKLLENGPTCTHVEEKSHLAQTVPHMLAFNEKIQNIHQVT